MSYIVPSTLVYQRLEDAGGVLNSTPDLDAVIIGPMYNVVRVDGTDGASLQAGEVTAISADVDGAVVMVAGSEISDWTAESLALIALGQTTGFILGMPGTYPGQQVVDAEVQVHISDAYFQVNTFEAALPAAIVVDKNLVGGVDAPYSTSFIPTSPAYGVNVALPDNSGNYAKVGDKVIYSTYDSGDVLIAGPTTTTIIAVNTDGSLRLAAPVPALATAGDYMLAKVYRALAYSVIDDTIVTTNASTLDQVEVPFDASHFPDALVPADFGFLSGTMHVSYRALRTDKVSTVLTISNTDERLSQIGEATDDNPLGLGVNLALANTTSRVKAVSIESNDLTGYLQAMDLIEEEAKAYALCPLTQDEAILAAFKAHVLQMSEPENQGERVLLCNTAIRDFKYIGEANIDAPGDGDTLEFSGGLIYFEVDPGTDFISDGVTAGDNFVVTSTVLNGLPVGSYVIQSVTGATRLFLGTEGAELPAAVTAGSCSFYITRTLTKTQQAQECALRSTTFGSSRVWHVQPDEVGVDINGVTEYLPGYYLCAGMAGMTAGFPVQQGFTNISVAGINDLRHSNFYFKKEDLNTMAEAGTCIYVQKTQGGIPYCRHELTTDVSVLPYREIVKVKNNDFLAYYFRDKLNPFIGSWNITVDTLNTMRMVTTASADLLLDDTLPRIGAPLLSYDLRTLEQDESNKDQVNIELKVETVTPNNYTNLFLII